VKMAGRVLVVRGAPSELKLTIRFEFGLGAFVQFWLAPAAPLFREGPIQEESRAVGPAPHLLGRGPKSGILNCYRVGRYPPALFNGTRAFQ
jgi:hypothetical protein